VANLTALELEHLTEARRDAIEALARERDRRATNLQVRGDIVHRDHGHDGGHDQHDEAGSNGSGEQLHRPRARADS
jgi:hypothetical protein